MNQLTKQIVKFALTFMEILDKLEKKHYFLGFLLTNSTKILIRV